MVGSPNKQTRHMMKYRLPVKIIIVKHTVRGMIALEQIAYVGNPQYGVQPQPIEFKDVPQRLWGTWHTVADPTLVERVLCEAFNHLGPSVVQAVVDLTRTIHDGSSRNLAVANEPYPMTTRSNPCELGGRIYWIHGRDLPGYPASHGWIPPTISRCRMNDAWKVFAWVLGDEVDEDHVIPSQTVSVSTSLARLWEISRSNCCGAKTGFNLGPMVLVTVLSPGALCASTLNDTHQNDHNRDDQEGMNESAHGVRGNKTQNPEDDQDDGDGLEHGASPFAIR